MGMAAVPEFFTQSLYNTTQQDLDFGIQGNQTTAISDNYPGFPPLVVHAQTLRAVYIWILTAIGLPGNAACLVTVVSTQVVPLYIVLLAIADIAALVVKLIYHQLITYEALNSASCYVICSNTFLSCYANWILVLVCFDRYLSVCRPYKRQVWFNKRRMVVTFVVITAFLSMGILPTCYFTDGVHESGSECRSRQGTEHMSELWERWVTTHLFFTAPFLVISVLTALSVRGLQRMRVRRQSVCPSRQSGPEHAVSRMMVGACVVFLLLTLPATIYHIWLKYVLGLTPQSFMVYQVVTFMSDANHALNFFIYCFISARFRQAVLGTWCCRCLRLFRYDVGRSEEGDKESTKDQAVNNAADSNGSEMMATTDIYAVQAKVARNCDTPI